MAGIDPLSAVEAGIGIVTAVGGAIGRGKANREIKSLLAQRKAFETPDEIFQILNATQANASNGLGSDTLSYLTSNIDNAASSAIGASTLLGGDPNDLSAIFGQQVNNIMKVGADNQAANLANFSKYLAALNTVAENNAAEQVSRDNLLKDRIQAAASRGNDANKNISTGLNTVFGALSASEQMSLFKQQRDNQARDSFFSVPDLNSQTTVTRVADNAPLSTFDQTVF